MHAANTGDGIRAVRGRNPIDPDSVRRYLEDKFGDDLKAVRAPPTWAGASLLTAVKIARVAPNGEPVADRAQFRSEASGQRSVRRAERATPRTAVASKLEMGHAVSPSAPDTMASSTRATPGLG